MKRHFTPLLKVLQAIPDPREAQGKRHPLGAILSLICLAVVCGYRSYTAISEFGRKLPADLRKLLGFTQEKSPCSATFFNTLKELDLSAVESLLGQWSEEVLEASHSGEKEVISFDGKTLRGSKKQGHNGSHLLAGISQRLSLPLNQFAVPEKTNEITAMKHVLKGLFLEGKLLTMDALLTQRKIAEEICSHGGDYLMPVKGNQDSLQEDVEDIVALEAKYGNGTTTYSTLDKGHGRIESRTIEVAQVPEHLVNWPHLKQVFIIERYIKRGDKISSERVAGITSLSSSEASASQLLNWTRQHWSIENKTHFVRDVTYDEDRSQVRTGSIPQVMASFRNLAIGLIHMSGWKSVASAHRHFILNLYEAFDVISMERIK